MSPDNGIHVPRHHVYRIVIGALFAAAVIIWLALSAMAGHFIGCSTITSPIPAKHIRPNTVRKLVRLESHHNVPTRTILQYSTATSSAHPEIRVIGDSSWINVGGEGQGSLGVRGSLQIVYINGQKCLWWQCLLVDSARIDGTDTCAYALAYNDSILAGLTRVWLISYKDSIELTNKFDYAVENTYCEPYWCAVGDKCRTQFPTRTDMITPNAGDEYVQDPPIDGLPDGQYELNIGVQNIFPYPLCTGNCVSKNPFLLTGDAVSIDWTVHRPPDPVANLLPVRNGKTIHVTWTGGYTKNYIVRAVTGKNAQTITVDGNTTSADFNIPQKSGTNITVQPMNNFGNGDVSPVAMVK